MRQFMARHGPMMLGLLAVALMWLRTLYAVQLDHASARRAAVESTGNLARAFEQHILRTIQSIDQSLLYLRSSLALDPESFDIGEWVRRHHALADLPFQIGIIDKNGFLAGSNLRAPTAVDLSNREHFRVHADTSEDHLFISKPVLGRVSQQWSIQFTRRLFDRNGDFAGVAVASVSPSYFSDLYGAIDVGRDGSVMLIGLDGTVRARATRSAGVSDLSYADKPFFKTMLAQPQGSMTIRGEDDGLTRIHSYRAVSGHALVVDVGFSVDDVFRTYTRQRNVAYAATTVLSALVLLFAWILRGHHDRLEGARRELKRRSMQYRRVVDGIDEVIFQLDDAGRCVFLNAAWHHVTGHTVAETLGRPLSDFIEPCDRHKIDIGRRTMDDSFPTARFLTRTGHPCWLEVHTRPEFADRETGGTVFGTLTNVTSWYVADLAKRESDARAHAILESAVDGILSINDRGQMERVNSGLLRMFRMAEADVLGRPVSDLAPGEVNRTQWNVVERILAEGCAAEAGWWGELICRRADGSEFPAGLTLSEMQLPSRRHFTCVIRDVTERKKIEKLKDDFVATVSHELRTPMAAIVGSLGLIRAGAAGALPQTALGMVELAHRNCGRMVRLLDDILDMERIGTGRLELKLQDVDINQIVAEAVSLIHPQAAQRDIAVNAVPMPGPAPVVRADPDRISQVLVNLISNAVKYSSAGDAVTVTVAPTGPRYRISVKDQGPGVPEDFKSQIFKRFARADSSDDRARGGTGLGLFISKLIVEQHGGTIGFTSEPGAGATFHVELGTGRARLERPIDGRAA